MKGFFFNESTWLIAILIAVQTKSLLFGFEETRSSWASLACLLLFCINIEVRMLRKTAQRNRDLTE